MGFTNSTIIASSSTAFVYGDDGADRVGGLVGQVDSGGTVTASYASGAVDGSNHKDSVGGLVGYNNWGAIRASYATGNVDGGAGTEDRVGGLVGSQEGRGSTLISNSYAIGNVDGGAGARDIAGRLLGRFISGRVIASYGFGTISGSETVVGDTSSRPSEVRAATRLTAPGSAAITAAPAQWHQAASDSFNAWDFGTNTQAPALRYADYDGTGGTDYCAHFGNIPGTDTAIVCGTTLLPGQR